MASSFEHRQSEKNFVSDQENRIPTSVIPTVSGTLWQSIDPHGFSQDGDVNTMVHNLSTSNNSLRRQCKPLRCSVRSAKKFAPVCTRVENKMSTATNAAISSIPVLDNRLHGTQLANSRSHSSSGNITQNLNVLRTKERLVSSDINISNMPPHIISSPSSIDSKPIGQENQNINLGFLPDRNSSYPSILNSDPGSGGTANSRVQRMADRLNKNKRCRLCIWFLALLCAANVVFFLLAYDKVVETVAANQLALRDSGTKFDAWTKTSVPVFYKVTIFNMTNPSAFMNGARPRVHELGPYTYRMSEEKMDIQFHDNGTVTYRTKPSYFFEPTLSSGSEDDMLYTVNIPFINTADAVKDNPFLKIIINYAASIHNFKTIRHLSVRELLWGHQSNVLDWGRMFQELPYPHPDFGLLVGLNNTLQESYTMYTGVGQPSKMNAIHAWNGRTKLDFWNGDSCNKIYGTDAGGFSPGVVRTDTLHIFNGQLCRSIPLVYQKNVRMGGINAYRFVPPPDIFSYGPANPENACFCSGGQCPPRGVLDMKPCYWGAAIAFSFPHFYQADPTLRHMVKGMR